MPQDIAHFQRFMTKKLLDDCKTHSTDIKGLKELERISLEIVVLWVYAFPSLPARGRIGQSSLLAKRRLQGGHLKSFTYDPRSLVDTVDRCLTSP